MLSNLYNKNDSRGVRGFAQLRLCVLKATQAYYYEEARNYEKILFIQSIVENGWQRGCIPLDPTLKTEDREG